MDQREKFEASREPRTDLGFRRERYKNPVVQKCWEAWQAAIAAQEPKKAMSDAEIKAVVTAALKAGTLSWIGYEKDADDKCTIPVLSKSHYQLARAIERATSPNKELVEAARLAYLHFRATALKTKGVAEFQHCSHLRDKLGAALRAAGVEVS